MFITKVIVNMESGDTCSSSSVSSQEHSTEDTTWVDPGGGGGVLPYMGYVGTCRGILGFLEVLDP